MKSIIIRAKSFESWMKTNFSRGALKDIAEYGADAGWRHLTDYRDTCKIYNRFKQEVWEMLLEDTESFGYKNPFDWKDLC